MKRPLLVVAFLLLVAAAAGCSDQAEADGPPEIHYGRDICIECNMIISEPRFAAAYRLEGGDAKSFDGVGEMVKHGRRTGDFDRVTFAWVHDFNTEDWILVEEAFFVTGKSVVTPMGHGIVAFSTEAAADEFAGELGGVVIRWEEVRDLPITDRGLLGHHHEAGHDEDSMEHMEDTDDMDHMGHGHDDDHGSESDHSEEG
ncbi:MAG: nitrous oxide reductase accessory protein NosL [Acidimicrobiia bacterium]|nr:nitrous oxide reductase accessory protein NosL [Acidimicrobiia bacterium]